PVFRAGKRAVHELGGEQLDALDRVAIAAPGGVGLGGEDLRARAGPGGGGDAVKRVEVLPWDPPLCPAGHLPLKGGDRRGYASCSIRSQADWLRRGGENGVRLPADL